ncbi:MAG: hypothetical protein ABSH47_13500 [Bryobacteraceae bacterium]
MDSSSERREKIEMRPTAGVTEGAARSPVWRGAVVACAVILGFAVGRLNWRGSATVETNENLIIGSRTNVDVDDAAAVFERVFSALPLRTVVYPSGDHYYFSFPCTRGLIRGNLRLTRELRTGGTIGITYSLGVPGRDKTISVRLGRSQGLYMIGLGRRAWLCYYHWKFVVFLLNPSVAAPPIHAKLLPGETWATSVFDESGLQFHLIFQQQPPHLFWILNRDLPVAEDFDRTATDIAIGRRTRFAFYVDKSNDRWVLVGVDRRNSVENTWYDGPFDQLPNEEIEAGLPGFRKYLESVYPGVRGQIDDYGRYKLLPQSDVAVVPWMLYDNVEDLAFIEKCKQTPAGPAFYRCITPDPFAGK